MYRVEHINVYINEGGALIQNFTPMLDAKWKRKVSGTVELSIILSVQWWKYLHTNARVHAVLYAYICMNTKTQIYLLVFSRIVTVSQVSVAALCTLPTTFQMFPFPYVYCYLLTYVCMVRCKYTYPDLHACLTICSLFIDFAVGWFFSVSW